MAEMFRAVREPDPKWQEDLERYFPRSDRVPWLWIHWHAGIEYAPTMRWTIYAIQPRLDLVPEDLVACCKGEDPRTWGAWVTPKVKDAEGRTTLGARRWVSDSFISREQWLVFQATGGYPALYWVIQGDQGGHKWQVSQTEQAFLASIGKPDADTPQIGELPYAEYDNRVREKLLQADKLRQWRQRMDWEARYDRGVTEAGLLIQGERKVQREAYARQTLDWLDTQIVDAVSDIPRRVLGKILDELPTSDKSPEARTEALHEALIERA
jgi:hypothetical protein